MNTKTISGVVSHNGKQWMYEMTCGCDYCATFIGTAIAEAIITGSNDATINIRHTPDFEHNTVMVDCWS